MKKISQLVISISLVAATSLFAKNESNVLNELSNISFIKNGKFKLKELKDLGDVYAIKASHPRMPKLTLFVTKDRNTVILGNGFDKDGKIIEFPVDMSKYDGKESFTIGNGKIIYYVFTDPECPYCRKFENQLDKLSKDIQLKVFLFPLSFHKHSIAMSKYILSQKNNIEKAKAMKDIANNGTKWSKAKYTEKENKEFEKILAEHKQIGIDVGVRGTPAIFSSTGKSIPWPDLLKRK